MAPTATDLEAIIVGGGVSGIATACRLQMDYGLQHFRIFDKDTTWGGTWQQNQYPGCGCDIPTRLYSLSFAQRANWDKFFSGQAEINKYLHDVAREHYLDNKVHFRHEVRSADFDEENAHWVVVVRDLETNKSETLTARVVFSCVGALSVPRACDVPGTDTFKGAIFHSARWDKNVELQDKNVVVLGNGCTASQLVPEVAKVARQLTQIVRAKHWYLPHFKDLFEGPFFEMLQRHMPGWVALERLMVVGFTEGHFLHAFREDGKNARARVAQRSRDYIRSCAPPEYHDLLIPRPGELEIACKRRIFDQTYVPCLARDNVELTRDQADKIVEDGVILKSGRKIDADVIILANGFQTDQYALQMKVTNANGKTLEHYWKKDTKVPQAYRTELVSPFPNFFVIWGPNSVTGHFSAIWSQERAIEMAMRVLRPVFLTGNDKLSPLERSHGKSVRVRPAAEALEQEYIQEQMKDLIFTTGCGSWYTDQATGRVTAVSPSFQTTVAWRSKFPYYPDYQYKGVSGTEAWRSWPVQTRIASLLRLGATPTTLRQHQQRSILLRFLLFPWRFLRLLLLRSGIRLLRAWVWLGDMVFPYAHPQPLQGTGKKA